MTGPNESTFDAGSVSARLAATVSQGMAATVSDLGDLVRIPSVSREGPDSAEVARSAETIAALLADAGLPDVRVLEATGGGPAVIGRSLASPGQPTVLLYAHHDVQPAGELGNWLTDPFEPVVRDGRLHGRGSADDKAGVITHVAALRALREVLGEHLGVGVTVFVEGEEEVGSPTFGAFLDDYRDLFVADVVVIADSSVWSEDIPAFTTSLRGLVDVVVEVRTHTGEQHSGVFGGLFPDALTALCRILAQLHDDDGEVAVPGLVRGPAPEVDVDEAELRAEAGVLSGVAALGRGSAAARLWTVPAVSVLGIDAPATAGAANVLLPVARAKVSLRIAPGQDPVAAQDALIEHLQASAPWGVHVTCTRGPAGSAIAITPTGRLADVASAAFTEAWEGTPPVHMGIGGSIPFIAEIAERIPEATILVVGAGDPSSCWHGANESVSLKVLERLILAESLLIAGMAREG